MNMINRIAISAALILAVGVGVPFAKGEAAPQQEQGVQETPQVKVFNDILFKLVRQDEYLDEALEILDTASGRPGVQDLAALRVSLKTVTNNLRHIDALNKKEFDRIGSDPAVIKYTNTILSYSRKVDRKTVRLVSAVSDLSKKDTMRDAVSSRKKGDRRKTRAKKITEILRAQKEVKSLAGDIKSLRSAARRLSATSNWLYIASK